MSAAVKDLPDPLDTSPAMATSSPDDLLAKMADEAIDRLMADADKGGTPASPLPVVDEMPASPPAATTAVGVGRPAIERPTTPTTTPAILVPAALEHPIAAAAAPTESAAPIVIAGVAPTVVPPAAPPAIAEPPPAPAADVKALRQESSDAHPTSPLLLPLTWVNAPFANLSDDARRIFGLLGLVTLVPGAMAIAYVVWLKHH